MPNRHGKEASKSIHAAEKAALAYVINTKIRSISGHGWIESSLKDYPHFLVSMAISMSLTPGFSFAN